MSAPYSFTRDDLLARSRRLLPAPPDDALHPSHVPARGDFLLNPEDLEPGLLQRAKPAAVLIGLVPRDEGVTVLLTQRTAQLRAHSGQVAFPGGKIDAEDASPIAAALREAQEEIGLDPALVTPLGYLDCYLSSSGYRIVPVVGMVEPGFELTINEHEVDAAFETPLSFLMEPGNHARSTREWKGRERHFYEMPHGGRHIWGVTAGIIRAMYERLYG